MTPSIQQQAVIDELISGRGNIMVKALAGTGKTSLLMMMLPYVQGDVAMLAFNVSIKEELERRVSAMHLHNCNVDIKTVHGAGFGAYKFGGGARTTRVEKDKIYHILDELAEHDEVYSTYRNFLTKLVGFAKRAGIGPLMPNEPAEWQEIISYYSVDDEIPDNTSYCGGETEEDVELIENLIGYARNIYDISLSKCKEELDFDDMLLAPIHFNCRFKKYDYVFCDEVQDNSAIRQEITIRMVKPRTGRMIAVGDENQAIYGFCGAHHEVMDELKTRMDMKVLPLSVTYRCPQVVVAMANRYVPELQAHESAPKGWERKLWLEPGPCPKCGGTGLTSNPQLPTDGVTTGVVTMETADDFCPACDGSGKEGPEFWKEAPTLNSEDIILCRNNRPIVELAYQLLRKGIACKIEGRDFASSLTKLAQRWKVKELSALETKLTDFKEKESAKWRRKKNEERAVGVEDKVDTLLTLLYAVQESGKTRVADLVDRINIMFGDVGEGKPKVLTLSSVHKWKGRENRRVYILGLDRYMPSKWAKQKWEIKGEENLIYVGLTRSKEGLINIVVPEGNRPRRLA